MHIDLIITNIKECVTLDKKIEGNLREELKDPVIKQNVAIAIKDGIIYDIDDTNIILEKYSTPLTYDATNLVALPGFVDAHTHIIFANEREREFEMRIAGKTYKEISLADGGIRASVRDLRKASKSELIEDAKKRLNRMLKYGTTTIETKSGYGLDVNNEVKMLEVVQELDQIHPIDIIPTFLGAHDFPDEYRDNKRGYIDLLINEMLPIIKEKNLAEYCDIFTEEHVFNIEESREILNKAKELGFKIRMHADELEPIGGAELAVELGAVSADHLVAVSDKGIEMLANSDTIPIFLPGTTFSLNGKSYAPVNKFLDRNKEFALATDCNPGSSYTESMPIIITLACLNMKLDTSTALYASTYFAAKSLQMENKIGKLAKGYFADITLWEMNSYRSLPYHYGSLAPKIVVKKGQVVVDNYCITY